MVRALARATVEGVELLWAIPPVALATGAVLLIVRLREMAEAADELNDQLRRLGEVRTAVDRVRSETAVTRSRARSLRRP